MNDLLRSPLGPAIILLFGSLLLRISASPRRESTLALLTMAPLGAAFVLAMTLPSSEATRDLVWWPLVTPPLRVLWALDGWNWLGLTLALIVGASAILLTWQLPGKRSGAYHGLSLALLGAVALTVVSDSLLALGGAWVATDILLVARVRGSRATGDAPPVWLEVIGSLLVLVAIGITSSNVASTTLSTARLPAEAMALLLIVAALRMAAYPFHLWLAPAAVDRDRGTQLLISAVGIITGAWLLGRMFSLGAGVLLANPLWPLLLVLLALIGSFAAWVGSPRDRLAMLSSGRAAWLWVVAVLSSAGAARDALGWGMAGVVLALVLLAVGQSINTVWRWRVPVALAAVTMAGVPLLAGMPARAFMQPPLILLFLLVVADGLAVASVLEGWKAPADQTPANPTLRQPTRRDSDWPAFILLVALGLALVPDVLWGVQPTRLAVQAGFSEALSLGDLLRQLGFAQLLAIFAALMLGGAVSRLALQTNSHFKRRTKRLVVLVNLGWVVVALRWLVQWIDLAWRNMILVFEGEAYLGWVVLLLLLAALVVQL